MATILEYAMAIAIGRAQLHLKRKNKNKIDAQHMAADFYSIFNNKEVILNTFRRKVVQRKKKSSGKARTSKRESVNL